MAQRVSANYRLGKDPDQNAPVRDTVFGPFGGYLPNAPNNPVGVGVDSNLLDWRACSQLTGFVPRGEDLAPDFGWQQHQSAQMPLGKYINGGGVGPSATGLPIVHLVTVPATVSPNSAEENLAVTAKNSDNGTIWQYPGYANPDTWYSMASIAGGATGGTDAIITSSAEVWDSCVYPPGHTVLLTDGMGINYAGQQTGMLRYYTGRKWGAFPNPTGVTTFSVASLATHQDRVLALGTREDGTAHANRIRWTTAGWSTTLASPITLPSANLWNDAGAGAIDFEEDVGQGVACRVMRARVALYFSKGVIMLDKTGLYTRPYQRTLVTTQRGLVGTQAVTDVGDGVQFGIFNDGWFFFDEDGQFHEAGTVSSGGVTIRKWAQAFYDRLNGDNAYRTIVRYEPSRHFIKIAFPDGTDATAPNTVWTYDIHGDRVWPDSYQGATSNNNPLCWGETLRFATSGTTWDSLSGVWDEWVGAWGDSAVIAKSIFTHATANGIIYQHMPNLVARDGENPTFEYLSVQQACSDPSQFKLFEQFILHYMKVSQSGGVAPVTFALVDGRTGDVKIQRNITLTSDVSRAMDAAAVWFRQPLVQARIRLTGTHPFVLRGFEIEWMPNMGDLR